LRKAITYIYTFLHTAKKFGFVSTVELYFTRDVFVKQVLKFRPKSWNSAIYIRQNTSDWTVFQEVFFNRNYNIKIPFTPRVIVDCGANIGLVSLYFIQKYPSAKIIAVEPEEKNYAQLKMNVSKYHQISTIKGGIWNKSTFLEVADSSNMGSWGFSCSETPADKPGAVRAYSIEELMSANDLEEIDILKLDIEGSELEVFSSNYQNWLPKTRCIIIELHDWRRKGCSKVFFNTLFQYDFSIYTKGETIICYRNS
jgi:FkbM family methyltransferase